MVGWSLGRAAGERAAAGVKSNNDAAAADSPVRKPFRSTSAANRARPSSMISLDFPATDVVAEAKVGEDELVATSLQHDRSPTPASTALHMLAAAQQRDKAQRHRTTSTGSSHSTLADQTDGKRRPRKSSSATKATTTTTTTTSGPLPSLIKTHATRSPVAALSTASTLASPPSDRKTAKDSRASLSPTDSNSGREEEQPLRSGPTRHTKALSNITNKAAIADGLAEDDASIASSQRGSRTKTSKTRPIAAADSARDSLLRLKSKEHIPDAPTDSKIACESGSEAQKPIEAPQAEPEQNGHSAYPYEIRKRRTKAQRNAAQDSTSTGTASDTRQGLPVRYEVTLVVNRSLAPLSFCSPQAARIRRLSLIGITLPSRLACDRVAHWTVERGARIAACVVNLLGS